MMERLQKAIAHSGAASRRKAEEMIRQGRVRVNGRTVTELGTCVRPEDVIEVDGIRVLREEFVYYVLNKPVGVLSAAADDRGRKTVADLIPAEQRIYPVGRLDCRTSGVILLTNDGEFANLMTHPRYGIEKEYAVSVRGQMSRQDVSRIGQGITLSDGTSYAGAKVSHLAGHGTSTEMHVTLHEGKNREIRRMMEFLGYPVVRLERVRFGCVSSRGLQAGEYRALTQKEIRRLRQLAERGGGHA